MINEVIYIKNMVCNRCIMVVEQIFLRSNIIPVKVTLGQVFLSKKILDSEKEWVKIELGKIGLAFIEDRKEQLVNVVKSEVINWVQEYNFKSTPLKLSIYLEQNLKKEYNYLSNIFSEVEGCTIEHYLIVNRIEKVKELLVYNELKLSEIALKVGFSSSPHLSSQFKKITGLTPSQFKTGIQSKRKPIDEL